MPLIKYHASIHTISPVKCPFRMWLILSACATHNVRIWTNLKLPMNWRILNTKHTLAYNKGFFDSEEDKHCFLFTVLPRRRMYGGKVKFPGTSCSLIDNHSMILLLMSDYMGLGTWANSCELMPLPTCIVPGVDTWQGMDCDVVERGSIGICDSEE